MDLSSQAVGPKIRWLRKNEPGVWARTRYLATTTTYLVHRLTGTLWIDHHTASHFMPLYNPHTRRWDERYAPGLASLNMLPQLGWSHERAGEVTREAAQATGLRAGTPVAVVKGDDHSDQPRAFSDAGRVPAD